MAQTVSVDDAGSRRTGPELIRATAPFESECVATSRRLLASTVLILASLLALVVVAPWPVQIVAGLLAGLVQVRLFIFYHDTVHGAIFRKAPIIRFLMGFVGVYLLAVQSVWKETHDFHHQNNGKILGSSVGSFPIMTVAMQRQASGRQKLAYRWTRHPITIACGYLTVFLMGMVLSPFWRNPKRHWMAPLSGILHVAAFIVLSLCLGWMTGFCLVILPATLSLALGSYLFYAQHNFPTMVVPARENWTFTDAALRTSSMFEMNPVMHWFTGNIGYHHVHHLNHRIPFYRLPAAMAGIPELQDPQVTSWRIRDVLGCLSLFLWDPARGKMLTYAEVRADRRMQAAA